MSITLPLPSILDIPFQEADDPLAVRGAFAHHPSGIAALCAEIDGEPHGLVASSFTVGVSLEPPLVLFSSQNTSRTWPRLRRSSHIGVSVLAGEQSPLVRQIASTKGDRFAGLDYTTNDDGALFLPRASLWLDCSIEVEVPAGDHTVVLLRVHHFAEGAASTDPLVFHGSAFRRLA